MGTSIELTVDGVSLDYAKNHMGNNYGYLFQEKDLGRRTNEGIDYDHYRDDPELAEELAESELAFVRPLRRMTSRLAILGCSLDHARAEYEAIVAEAESIHDSLQDEELTEHLSFDEFCRLANLFPLNSLAVEYIDFDTENRSTVAEGRFAQHAEQFSRLPWTEKDDSFWSEASYLSAKVCILSPFSMLLVFALNLENAEAEVVWQFGPIVNAGWVERPAFSAGALRAQTVLVATEGASDARILRRVLDQMRPDVADFFRFIDGDERHHFWGTGNLVRFAEGLLRIDVQNRVLFLLDNDAEGVDAFRKLQELKMPSNLQSMVLPEIDELRSFPALGPDGMNICDINGRAAAIECYLDLHLPGYPAARVVWSNYKRELGVWQGTLEHKESYDRYFMNQDDKVLTSGAYDMSKLARVIDALIATVSRSTYSQASAAE
jgi:hypothetical protein